MSCQCFIIPTDVLERFARDTSLSESQRKSFADTAQFDKAWRNVRTAHGKMSAAATAMLAPGVERAAPPAVSVYNCNHGTTLPGAPVPPAPADATSRRVIVVTTAVAAFYQKLFERNSVDDAGKALMSSIHFGVNYNNAYWNGTQMTYGDGDGNIFIDFTRSDDVIGHELTHGVTQYSSQFAYTNEAGGLNESMSDVFGSMFRQWRAKQTVDKADWLIGKGIMGPGAIAKGYTCLRDMANPAAKHCLAPQPTHYSKYKNGMDPHASSGIPNLAFCRAAQKIGGNSWDRAGKIWYGALTGFKPNPNMKMKSFADRTRTLANTMFPGDPAVLAAVDNAWKGVGL